MHHSQIKCIGHILSRIAQKIDADVHNNNNNNNDHAYRDYIGLEQKKWHLNARNVNSQHIYTHSYYIKIDEFHQPTRDVMPYKLKGDRSKRGVEMNVIC